MPRHRPLLVVDLGDASLPDLILVQRAQLGIIGNRNRATLIDEIGEHAGRRHCAAVSAVVLGGHELLPGRRTLRGEIRERHGDTLQPGGELAAPGRSFEADMSGVLGILHAPGR